MTPRTVNAYYSAASNEIVFPAGILQPPLFHKDLPLSINYGAIGTVIGHEITHGFDNQGREFDADGNMKSWWTKFASDNFENKTKCFINQYSSFAIEGQNENGQRTLGENIADNGGIKLSYLAYQKHKQQTSNGNNDRSLPGLDYNNNQLFFIAFAHVCHIIY
jgi:predicted metalloendopeptidase